MTNTIPPDCVHCIGMQTMRNLEASAQRALDEVHDLEHLYARAALDTDLAIEAHKMDLVQMRLALQHEGVSREEIIAMIDLQYDALDDKTRGAL